MPRKTPIRTCIACGASGDKRGLLRVVRLADGNVCIDVDGKRPGRGAYVCPTSACFERACDRRLFDAKLRVRIGAEGYQQLEDEFRALNAGVQSRKRDGD